ncbi:MAG: glycosyltransferase [Chlorobium phaeovibrioides]|nr:glycosyltransferase [Chlorobium phaeovibrioides]
MPPQLHLVEPSTAALVGLTSTAMSVLIVLTGRWHGKHTHDSSDGVQKFHTAPTPRIGGLAIFAALFVAWLLLPKGSGMLLGLMLIASLPAFVAGFIEDLTKRVGVRERLLATILSGVAAYYLTGYSLTRVDVPGFDVLLQWMPFTVAFTAFAVGGVANSVNIIDGFNGLAGGVLMICFGMLAAIAWQVGDTHVAKLCILFILCVAGFMFLNFPFGKIFMGDGGAYLMGFLLAWTAVMLPARNPEVSPWAPIVVCSYPLIETLFSMFRRIWTRSHPGQPDTNHLHSLVKLKIVRRYLSRPNPSLRNSAVSPFCWVLAFCFAVPATFFYADTAALMLSSLGMFLIYGVMHAALSRMPVVVEDGGGASR